MEIKSTRQASRAMHLAFRLSMKSIGKSDDRRSEIRATAKKLIGAAEDYMAIEKIKYLAEIETE